MSLSARERHILSEIERHLTASEPALSRALASMRPGTRSGIVAGTPARQPHGGSTTRVWVIAMIAGLLAGIAALATGLVLDILALVIVGVALTQVSLVTGWLAGALRLRQQAGQAGRL